MIKRTNVSFVFYCFSFLYTFIILSNKGKIHFYNLPPPSSFPLYVYMCIMIWVCLSLLIHTDLHCTNWYNRPEVGCTKMIKFIRTRVGCTKIIVFIRSRAGCTKIIVFIRSRVGCTKIILFIRTYRVECTKIIELLSDLG